MVDSTYYTPREVADLLGVDDEQVLAWIHSGELEAVNVAKSPQGKRPRWRISESACGRLLMRRRHPASQTPLVAPRSRRQKPKQYV